MYNKPLVIIDPELFKETAEIILETIKGMIIDSVSRMGYDSKIVLHLNPEDEYRLGFSQGYYTIEEWAKASFPNLVFDFSGNKKENTALHNRNIKIG
jgi:hypothetical protein